MENPVGKIAVPVARFVAILCGYGVLILSFAITVEIVGRKFFGFSLQGIDDIGGYALAIVAAIGASYTMAMRGHTRIDVFLIRMPAFWQAVLNAVAMVTLAGFAIFAFYSAARTCCPKASSSAPSRPTRCKRRCGFRKRRGCSVWACSPCSRRPTPRIRFIC